MKGFFKKENIVLIHTHFGIHIETSTIQCKLDTRDKLLDSESHDSTFNQLLPKNHTRKFRESHIKMSFSRSHELLKGGLLGAKTSNLRCR